MYRLRAKPARGGEASHRKQPPLNFWHKSTQSPRIICGELVPEIRMGTRV